MIAQLRVRVPDVDRLVSTYREFTPRIEAAGGRPVGIFYSESDPNEITILEEWSGPDGLLEMLDRHVREFNATAGTESVAWDNRILRAVD
jgi:hypothetical protein